MQTSNLSFLEKVRGRSLMTSEIPVKQGVTSSFMAASMAMYTRVSFLCNRSHKDLLLLLWGEKGRGACHQGASSFGELLC